MHLIGVAKLVLPAWEPDQGWRVLDPDGHLVDAGPKTIITVELVFEQIYGVDGATVPLLRQVSLAVSEAGWLVVDPDGNVVASGPQTVTDASAGAGEEKDSDGCY